MKRERTPEAKAARPKYDAGSAQCAACPMEGKGGAVCAGCPGPKWFAAHRSCHKCRFDGAGDGRCAICAGAGDEPSHNGASHVYIDATPDMGGRVLEARLDTGISPARIALGEEAEEAVRRLMAFFTALTESEFSLVKWLLSGGNLNTYALANNTRRQYVFRDVKDLMRRSPEIRAIVKERKQNNGRILKPRRGAAAEQSLLF